MRIHPQRTRPEGDEPAHSPSGDLTRRADRTARRCAVWLLAAFVALAVPVLLRWPPLVTGDLAVDVAAHAVVLREHLLLTAARVVTNAGSPMSVSVATVLITAVLLYRRRIAAAVYLATARLVELGAETGVKNLVGRPRPVWTDPVGHASSFSFPSGHAAGTAVLCTALLVIALPAVRRRALWVVLAGAMILAVAASRVLLGVHYPSDVLSGALLGIACALILRPLLGITGLRAAPKPERQSPA